MIKTKTQLKQYFQKGEIITEQDMVDLIDSLLDGSSTLNGANLTNDSIEESKLAQNVKTKLNAANVQVDNVTIGKAANGKLQIKLQGVGTNQLKDGSITQAKLHSSLTFNVDVDGVTIEKASNGKLQIKDDGVTYSKLAPEAVSFSHEFSLGRVDWSPYLDPNSPEKLTFDTSQKANVLTAKAVGNTVVRFKQDFSLPLNKKVRMTLVAKCKDLKGKSSAVLGAWFIDKTHSGASGRTFGGSKTFTDTTTVETVVTEIELTTSNTNAGYFELEIKTLQGGGNNAGDFYLYSILIDDVIKAGDLDLTAFASADEAKRGRDTTKIINSYTHNVALLDKLDTMVFGDRNSLPMNGKDMYDLYNNYLRTTKAYKSIDALNTELIRVKNLLSNSQTVNTFAALNSLKNNSEGDTAFVKDASADSNVSSGWAFYWFYNNAWRLITQQNKPTATIADDSISYKKLDNKALATTHEFSLGRVSWADYITNKNATWNTSEKGNQLNSDGGSGRTVEFKQRFSLPLNKKMKFSVFAKCIEDTTPSNKYDPTLGLEVFFSKSDGSGYYYLPTKEAKFSLNETKTVEFEFEVDKDGKTSNNQKFDELSYFYLKILASNWGKFVLYSVVLKDVVEENDLSENIKQLLTNNSPAHEIAHYDWHRHIWEEDHGDLIFRGKNYFTKYNFYTLPNNWDMSKTVELTEGFNDGYVTGQSLTLELVFYFNSTKFNNANLITDNGKTYLNVTGSGNSVGIEATKHKRGDSGYVIENMIELKKANVGSWFICRVAVEITDYVVGSSYTFRLINYSSKSGVTTQNILKDDFALSIVQYAGTGLKVTDIGLSYEKILHRSDVVSNYKTAKSNGDKIIPSSVYSIKELHEQIYSTVITAGAFASGDRKSAGEYQITMSADSDLFNGSHGTFSNLVNGVDVNYTSAPPDINKIFFSNIVVTGKSITFDFTNANALNNGVLKDYEIVFKAFKLTGSSSVSHGTWKFQTGDDKDVYTDSAHTSELLTTNTKISFGNGLTPTRKLRMVGVSGSVSSGPWLGEVFFEYYLKLK